MKQLVAKCEILNLETGKKKILFVNNPTVGMLKNLTKALYKGCELNVLEYITK